MNTQHLQYIIEIERTRSISQAAENLFLGQPNLSRILRDMEESAGFAIFERTSKGVRPTERGALFLQHARSILREVESIDALGPRHPVPNRLRVCIPRSVTVFEAVAEYLSQLPPQQSLRAIIRECHARQALQWLVNGEAELALIRFRSEYRDYFAEQSAANGLELQILSRFRYQLLMHRSHPLARKPSLTRADLAGFPEIVHSDLSRTGGKNEEQAVRKIYTVDRMAQLTLLETLPGSYLWTAPLPVSILARWNLIQKFCTENQAVYHDALLTNLSYKMTETEEGFRSAIVALYKSDS